MPDSLLSRLRFEWATDLVVCLLFSLLAFGQAISQRAVQASSPFPLLSSARHVLYVLDPRGGSSITQMVVVDPDSLRVIGALPAGYDPQIAVSPNGRRLYLTDTEDGTEMLTVIETGTWKALQRLESPHRIKHKVFGQNAMAVSEDGRRLFIHKWRYFTDRFESPTGTNVPRSDDWWDVLDTIAGKFLPYPPHVANAGIAKVLPSPGGDSLAILSFNRSELVFVDLQTGETIETVPINSGPSRRTPFYKFAAGAIASSDGSRIYAVTGNGHLLVVNVRQRKLERMVDLDLAPEQRIPPDLIVLSPTGDRLYVGVGAHALTDSLYAQQVRVFDTESWKRVSLFKPARSTFAMALSPDGRRLYTVDPSTKTLTVLDAASGEEAGVLHELGETPSLIVVAPLP